MTWVLWKKVVYVYIFLQWLMWHDWRSRKWVRRLWRAGVLKSRPWRWTSACCSRWKSWRGKLSLPSSRSRFKQLSSPISSSILFTKHHERFSNIFPERLPFPFVVFVNSSWHHLSPQGWMPPEPQSESEDLCYHEHKPFSPLERNRRRETSQEEVPGNVVRRPHNPLDIAVIRLEELERNIERRYPKRPSIKWCHCAIPEWQN